MGEFDQQQDGAGEDSYSNGASVQGNTSGQGGAGQSGGYPQVGNAAQSYAQQPSSEQPYDSQQPAGWQPYSGQSYSQQPPRGQTTSQQPFGQQQFPQAPYGQPQPALNNGFAINVVGLILSVLQICIPGLICNIIGFSRASKARKAQPVERPGENTKASWIIGLVGLVFGGLALIAQIIICIALVVVVNQSGGWDNLLTNGSNTFSGDGIEYGDSDSSESAPTAKTTTGSGTSSSTGTQSGSGSATSVGSATGSNTDSGSTTEAQSMQLIGEGELGFMSVPSSWVECVPNGEDSDDVVAFADPQSGDDGFFGTYTDSVEMTGWYYSQDEFAKKLYDSLSQESYIENISMTSQVVNGQQAAIVSYSFSGTNQVAREYVFAFADGECTDVYVESTAEDIDKISAYAETYSVERVQTT